MSTIFTIVCLTVCVLCCAVSLLVRLLNVLRPPTLASIPSPTLDTIIRYIYQFLQKYLNISSIKTKNFPLPGSLISSEDLKQNPTLASQRDFGGLSAGNSANIYEKYFSELKDNKISYKRFLILENIAEEFVVCLASIVNKLPAERLSDFETTYIKNDLLPVLAAAGGVETNVDAQNSSAVIAGTAQNGLDDVLRRARAVKVSFHVFICYIFLFFYFNISFINHIPSLNNNNIYIYIYNHQSP